MVYALQRYCEAFFGCFGNEGKFTENKENLVFASLEVASYNYFPGLTFYGFNLLLFLQQKENLRQSCLFVTLSEKKVRE